MTNKRGWFGVTLYILLISLPYMIGWVLQGSQIWFSGLFLNPIDGYSYFAKMQQGAEGLWFFTLPFTAQPGDGVVLFEFYIFLGHLSRITHFSIPFIFHLARILCSVFLFYQLWQFILKFIKLDHISKKKIFFFVLFSSGMGWTALLFGYKSADFWVAEAYPFFSSLISPHFTFGMAIFLWLVNHIFERQTFLHRLVISVFSIFLCLAMPFASVILCMIIGIAWIAVPRWRNRIIFFQILYLVIPSAIFLGWQYLTTLFHPQLSIWNQQNVTVSPPLWDLLISFSPMMVLTLLSFRKGKEYLQQSGYQISFIWFVSCLALTVFPFSLQRRFLFSFSIPVTILALYELDTWVKNKKWARKIVNIFFALPLVTIVMLYMIMAFSIIQRSPYSYLTKGEMEAYSWIQKSTDAKSVILSDETHALKIPAITGHRVFYGHPFETVNAVEKQNQLNALLSCNGYTIQSAVDFLQEQDVDEVLLPMEIYRKAECLHELRKLNQNLDFVFLSTRE